MALVSCLVCGLMGACSTQREPDARGGVAGDVAWPVAWPEPDWAALQRDWEATIERVHAEEPSESQRELLAVYHASRTSLARAAHLGEPVDGAALHAFRQAMVDEVRRLGPAAWRDLRWRFFLPFAEALDTLMEAAGASGTPVMTLLADQENPATQAFWRWGGDFFTLLVGYGMVDTAGNATLDRRALPLFFAAWWGILVGDEVLPTQRMQPAEREALALWQLGHVPHAPYEVRVQWVEDARAAGSRLDTIDRRLVLSRLRAEAGAWDQAESTLRSWVDEAPQEPLRQRVLSDFQSARAQERLDAGQAIP